MEKEEVSLPTLKAAAGNPEGSFTLAAAEAGLEVGGDAPVMTGAVGSLITAVVGKTWLPAWTSLQKIYTQNGCGDISEQKFPG